jgi:hypothetical protein
MKKYILFAAALFTINLLSAQSLKDLKKSADKLSQQVTGAKPALSNDEIIGGLKEALAVGSQKSTDKLSAADGFFKDAAIKILMPEEAKKVEKTLRGFGMGKLVDNAILSMNRAAEDAAKTATPIFIDAIKSITIQDGLSILRGADNAATVFLKDKTVASLTTAFRPIIEASMQKTDATKHWNTLFTNYNKFSSDKVNTDLAAYVTEKALAGIFYQLAQEEMKIRKDPVARTTDLLKKVFAN